MSNETFLTKRQLEILKLRNTGLSQAEIARQLGTTRANISATEKTAKENIKKAENTLKLSKMIKASAWVKVEKDTDLQEIPKKIFEAASKAKIWVNLDTPTLIGFIARECKDKIKGRRIISELDIGVTREGDIIAR